MKITLKVIALIWLLAIGLSTCCPSNDALAASAAPPLSVASTFSYDRQNEITITYDGNGESVINYDSVCVLTNHEKENGTAKCCVPFTKFSEFLAAEGPGILVNLGGEGEIPGVINQNLPVVLQDSWRSSAAGRTLAELQAEGHQFVISENTALPFENNSVRTVFSNNSPIGGQTWLGPGIQPSEVQRILQSGGQWIHNGEAIFTKP